MQWKMVTHTDQSIKKEKEKRIVFKKKIKILSQIIGYDCYNL